MALEWLSFMQFRAWMVQQDWEGMDLDKDLLIYGNKLYGPETCCFVSRALNNLLSDHAAARGDWPQGVYFHKQARKYRARLNRYGKRVPLGMFDTPQEASITYMRAKSAHVSEVADATSDPRIAAALREHATRIQAPAKPLD